MNKDECFSPAFREMTSELSIKLPLSCWNLLFIMTPQSPPLKAASVSLTLRHSLTNIWEVSLLSYFLFIPFLHPFWFVCLFHSHLSALTSVFVLWLFPWVVESNSVHQQRCLFWRRDWIFPKTLTWNLRPTFCGTSYFHLPRRNWDSTVCITCKGIKWKPTKAPLPKPTSRSEGGFKMRNCWEIDANIQAFLNCTWRL